MLRRKHYKNSVFSRAQLLRNTVSNSHFFTHPKNTFSKKVSFLLLPASLKPLLVQFFLGWAKILKRKHLWLKEIVCTKKLFSPFQTQIVFCNCWKWSFLIRANQHKTQQPKKCTPKSEKTLWNPDHFCFRRYVCTNWHYLWSCTCPKTR